ncbi:MAG: dephospho-CoA kinase [Actinomycetota bacterium]
MKVVGLTGGIAVGKSTVAKIFESKGAAVLDADLVARQVVAPGMPAHSQLVSYFGRDILLEDGQIDRARLADLAFTDEATLRALEDATHPAIFQEIAGWLERLAPTTQIAVVEAALLVETFNKWKAHLSFRALVVVSASPALQMERIKSGRQMSEAEALNRIRAQAPDEKKLEGADFVIENRGSLEALRLETGGVWEALRALD